MIQASNVVILRGNLTSDPEFAGNNNSIAKFRVAVSNAGNDSANPDNKAGFFDVICFVNNAQCGDFVRRMISDGKLKKGSGAEIVGSLNHSRWSTDGNARSRVEIVMENFSFASGGGRDRDGGGDAPAASYTPSNSGGQASSGSKEAGGDDPFMDF